MKSWNRLMHNMSGRKYGIRSSFKQLKREKKEKFYLSVCSLCRKHMKMLNCKWEPQTGTSTGVWRVIMSCWCQSLQQKSELRVVFCLRNLGACCAAAASVCVPSHVCVLMWDMLEIPHIFFMCSLQSPSILGRSISCPKTAAPRPKSRLCSSLFTALACDGGATRSLPITDCHFDGDATGGESNSLSPSLWTTVYCLEGHKAASEHRDTHFHAHMHIYTLTSKPLDFLYADSLSCFVSNACLSLFRAANRIN